MSNEWITWILIVVILGLLIWNMSRRRRTGNSNVDAAMTLLSNIDTNLKIIQNRQAGSPSKAKFKTGGWNYYKDKLGFLDPGLLSTLSEGFTIAEDLNARIDAARKSNALSTLQDLPLDKLKESMTKGKQGLIAWIKSSSDVEQQNSGRRGCMGF